MSNCFPQACVREAADAVPGGGGWRGAALTFVVASGLMNWVFMTSLGKSEFEQQILGAVSVAVSAFLALLPTLLVWAFRERRIAYMVLGVPVFLAFAAFSLSSAVGFAAKNRGSLGEDRALASERLAGLRHELSETESKLKALGAARPLAVLDQLLRGIEQDRRWASSKECADATADASRSFCKGYFDLKAEAALAGEVKRHEGRIAESEAAGPTASKSRGRAARPTIRRRCWRACSDCRRRRSSAG